MTSALQDCASTATKRREGGRLRAIGAGLLLAAALLPAAGAGAQPTRRHEVWHLHWRAVAERGGGRCLLRHSLCGIAGGRGSLDAAATADVTAGNDSRRRSWAGLPAARQHRTAERGLPLPQRLCPGLRQRAFAPAGLLLDPWRCTRHRHRRHLRPLGHGRREQHRRGHDQLPPGSSRLAGRAGAHGQQAELLPKCRRRRQLRPHGPAICHAMGAREHRQFRRRPAPGDDRRRISGRAQRVSTNLASTTTARHLFRGAIIESGAYMLHNLPSQTT